MSLFSRKPKKEDMDNIRALLDKSKRCADTSNTTLDPAAFFTAYEGLEESLAALVPYEKKYKIFRGSLPSKNLEQVRQNRRNDENALIQRTFAQARDSGADKQQWRRYFERMEKYSGRMDEFNRKVLQELKHKMIEEDRTE